MATNYDIRFLRLMVRHGAAERPQALRCLEAIEVATQRGQPLNAAQAVLQLGLLGRAEAERIHHAVSRELELSGELLVPVDHAAARRDVSGEGEVIADTPDPDAPPPPPPPRPPEPASGFFDLAQGGEGLDDFELGPLLAHGAAGSSYVGRRKSDGAAVVVKTLSRRFADHPALHDQVVRELQAWDRFRHERVAATLAVGRSHGHSVVVFERAPGQPLESLLDAHGPLPTRQAVEIMNDVVEAVAAAHAEGLVVGDIRARKIYFDGQRARLTDLGLARASCLAQGFGQYGLPFGHPSYLAPEVLQEDLRLPTAAADLYALGILFYELLCGHVPFEGDVPEVLEQHLDAPLPPPPEAVTFSTATAGVILRLTAKTEDLRVADADALLRALRRLRVGKPFRLLSLQSGEGPVEAVTRDAWEGATEQESASPQWTETRIQKAPLVGPSDLAPVAATAPTGPVTARLPKELIAQLRAEEEAGEVDPSAAPPSADEARVEVGRKLGRGPIGASYEGRVKGHEGPVCVKVVSRKFAHHAELLERILGQLRAAKQVAHPNVVCVLDVLNASGRDVVIAERVQGRSLRALLEAEGPRPLRQATALISDVGAALEAAHAQGIFHGDVRPEKVFLDEEGDIARLADFGHAEASCLGAGFGKDGLSFGHPAYLAPEVVQERRREPDARTDIYALGCLYYELLCGKPPFTGATTKDLLLAHLRERLPPPPDEVAIPQRTADALLRMTAKDPARRFASIAELRAALRESLEVSASGEGPTLDAISALSVEEFDPMASAEDVSPEMWGMQSQVVARPAEGWAKDRIKQAKKEGPTSWVPGAKATQDTMGALYAQIREASGEHEAPRPRARAKADRGDGPAGFRATPGQLAATGGALVGVLVIMIVLVVVNAGQEPKPVVPPPSIVQPPPAPGPSPEEVAAQEERRLAVERAVQEYERDVRDLLRGERFGEALERDERLPGDLRLDPALRDAVRRLEGEVHQAAAERFRREQAGVEDLLARGELDPAAQRVDAIAAWAVDEAAVQQLRGRVEAVREAKTAAVRALAIEGPFDAAATRARLATRLRGWSRNGRLYPGGGATLHYRRGDATLGADLVAFTGEVGSYGPTPAGGVRGVHLKAGSKPLVAAIDLPFDHVIEVRIELVVAAPPGDEATVALLAGLDPRRPDGRGVSWGLIPVQRGPSGVRPILTVPFPHISPRRLIETSFRVTPGRGGRATLVGSLRSAGERQHTPKPAPISLRDLRGRVGLFVQDAECWVTELEVQGLVDPKGLE